MLARVIKTIEDFERIKENWDAVYSADPHTTFFVSWPWMLGWIKAWTGFTTEGVSHDWEIIAITPDAHSPYVAFMPVCTKTLKETGFALTRNLGIKTIYIGGYPWSDHTGFICLPEHVEEAVPYIATHIQRHMQWDIFDVRNIFDPRCDLLLKCFNGKKYTVKEVEGYPCPYIVLPDSWETYLQQYLGASTRRSLKYDTRKIQSLSEFHITHVNAENLESQIETLLTLYKARWGQKTETELNRFRMLFKTCFENNSLWLDILWDGSVPIAGFAVYLDHKIKSFTTYTIASNKKYAKWSPGAVMVGYSIRYAIENGFRIFDLGTGDEGYKYSFGSTDRHNRNIVIEKEFNINIKSIITRLKSKVPDRLKHLVKRTAERGLSWTVLYGIRHFCFQIIDRLEKHIMQIEKRKRLTGSSTVSASHHTIEENRELWNKWDWSQFGEEWTEDVKKYRGINPELWKASLVNEMMYKYIQKSSIVLEIGPGAGRWTELLRHVSSRLLIADISEKCLSICKERFSESTNIEYYLIGKRGLSVIPDNTFEYIWSYDVFVHINPTDIENYLIDSKRILKPGGVAIIHHAGTYQTEKAARRSFRSHIDGEFFLHLLEKHGLKLLEQNDSLPHKPGDLISVFTKIDTTKEPPWEYPHTL